ncbi:MAG: hypothetical protein BMS9Abin17_1012 [Acidimicrobiia bacterium]|nr:MAG: hypothetical protein BMS9Abin17_1012 [Acidimicrobiia bacterium]
MAANDYAVVVGINRYQGLNDLRGPENDAADFDAWLRKPTGGAVPGGNIARLLGSELGGGSLRPRVGDVDDEFEKLHEGLQVGNAGRTGRRLYIFLAGHGFDPDGTDAALLCASATRRRLGDHISGKLYSLWFRKAALFDEIALFMDCCRDDYSRAPLRPPPWLEEHRPDPGVRMFTALATRWAFQARERVDPDDPGSRVRGLFSKALLGMLNAGKVTGEELKRFTINDLATLVGQGEYQEPEINVDPGFVFSEAADPPRGTLTLAASRVRRRHMFRLNGPTGAVVGRQVVDSRPWTFPDLDFGMFVFTDEDTGEIRFVEIVRPEVDVTF